MAKGLQTRYVCRQCGFESAKWLGRCPSCDEWGTLDETVTASTPTKGLTSARAANPLTQAWVGPQKPQRLPDVPSGAAERRTLTGIGELDRVLGGGIVPGSLILIGGEPGVGKSTLLTSAAGAAGGEERQGAVHFRGRVGVPDQAARGGGWA